jgi:hypothetical protein
MSLPPIGLPAGLGYYGEEPGLSRCGCGLSHDTDEPRCPRCIARDEQAADDAYDSDMIERFGL